jgi:small subunit ribosomal protein S17
MRGLRKIVTGKVTSDKMEKTLSVLVETRVPHPMYGKFQRRRTWLKAHDENNEARIGDVVEVMETRPLSKTKRWRVIKIVKRAAKV